MKASICSSYLENYIPVSIEDVMNNSDLDDDINHTSTDSYCEKYEPLAIEQALNNSDIYDLNHVLTDNCKEGSKACENSPYALNPLSKNFTPLIGTGKYVLPRETIEISNASVLVETDLDPMAGHNFPPSTTKLNPKQICPLHCYLT